MRRSPLVVLSLLVVSARAPAQGEAGPLERLPDSAWTREAAAHLLRRAGFGGSSAEIDALHRLGLAGAVDRLVDFESIEDPDCPPFEPAVTQRPPRVELAALDADLRRERIGEYRKADRAQLLALRSWWLARMVRSRRPFEEKMTLFWHGHFTSGFRDVKNSYHMHLQNETLRRLGTVDFGELLRAVSRDPAMLEYLDNNTNRKAHPNENFARELLELFTLGVGHYSETDVLEAARAFTGWTFRGDRFVIDARNHDGGSKTFLGRTGPFGGDDVLSIVLEEPRTAEHVATKILRFFAHDAPSPEIVAALADVFRRGNYAVKPMMKALFLSREFYSERSVGTRVKSPIELVVGLFRALEMPPLSGPGPALAVASLGQDLFEPPNVKGWEGGMAWTSGGTLLARYNVALAIPGDAEDRAALLAGGRRKAGAARAGRDLFDAAAFARAHDLATAGDAARFLTGLLLASPAPPELSAALVAELGADFSLEAPDAGARLRRAIQLLVSTPEFQLS